eukprot:1194746-Prorocentrum_minimum.AAC.8
MVGREEEEAEVKKENKKEGFTEDDQENLYNLTQSGKTSGKQGLGQRSKNKASSVLIKCIKLPH